MPPVRDHSLYETAPHTVSPGDHVHVWFTEPRGLLARFSGHLEADDARFLTETICPAMEAHWDPPFVFALDFQAITTFDTEFRKVLQEWGRDAIKRGVVDRVELLSSATPLVQMAVRAGTTFMRAVGMNISSHASFTTTKSLNVRRYVGKVSFL